MHNFFLTHQNPYFTLAWCLKRYQKVIKKTIQVNKAKHTQTNLLTRKVSNQINNIRANTLIMYAQQGFINMQCTHTM